MAGQTKGSAKGQGNPISQILQVLSAALRPLPTETGDGTYVKGNTTTGFTKDLGHFGVGDVDTLAELAKGAVTGDAVDDREYIMERVIQVCWKATRVAAALTDSFPARCGLAFDFSQRQGAHRHFPQYPLERLGAPADLVSSLISAL